MKTFEITPEAEAAVATFVQITTAAFKHCHDQFPRRLKNREEMEDLKAGRLLASSLFKERAVLLERSIGVVGEEARAAFREVLYQRWLKALCELFGITPHVVPVSMYEAINNHRRHYAELGPAEVN